MNDYNFGNFLVELRREKGLSQSELGEELGVTNKAVSKWELGVSKPRTEKLSKLAEVFGVTTDELLAGRRNAPQEKSSASKTVPQEDGPTVSKTASKEDGPTVSKTVPKEEEQSEIAFAIDVLLREHRKARRWFVFGVVLFLVAPTLAFLTVAVSMGTVGTVQRGATIACVAIFLLLHCLSWAVITVSGITMSKRKRILYKIFPAREEEIGALGGEEFSSVGEEIILRRLSAVRMKRLGLVIPAAVLLAVLAALAWLVCRGLLGMFRALLLACAAAFALVFGALFLIRRLVFRMRDLIQRGEYRRAIEYGKTLLRTWIPRRSMQIADTVRLNIAVAYFSLGEDRLFRAYLKGVRGPLLSVAKGYWTCLAALAEDNAAVFKKAYDSVEFPKRAKTDRTVAELTAYYGEVLGLLSDLVEGRSPKETKEAILARIENPRARLIVEGYGGR